MKVFGRILLVLGIICTIFGVVGLVVLANINEGPWWRGVGVTLVRIIGATDRLSLSEQIGLFAMENRILFLVSGLVMMVVGIPVTIVSWKK